MLSFFDDRTDYSVCRDSPVQIRLPPPEKVKLRAHLVKTEQARLGFPAR
jgi:hypothetical protein